MTAMTLAPAPLGGDDNPIDQAARAAGTADAYDDHVAGVPLTVLEGRRAELIAHLPEVDDAYTAYVLGYGATVITIRLHQEAVTRAESSIAFEDQENSTMSTTVRRSQPRAANGRFTPRLPALPLRRPVPEPEIEDTGMTDESGDHGARAHANQAALIAGIPARCLDWGIRPDGTAYQYLDDGVLLSHPGTYGAPLTALTTCAQGATHAFLTTSLQGLLSALDSADNCSIRHADFIGQPARPARNLAEAFAARPAIAATARPVPLAIPLAIAKGEPR